MLHDLVSKLATAASEWEDTVGAHKQAEYIGSSENALYWIENNEPAFTEDGDLI